MAGRRTAIRTYYCENLHANCYLNEEQAIVTSMNLTQYNQQKNWEIGVLDPPGPGTRGLQEHPERNDPDLPRQTASLRRNASKDSSDYIPHRTAATAEPIVKAPATGHCIRCARFIASDPNKPYCYACFQSWNQYLNPYYKEKICHLCSRKYDATIDKPCCINCYRKYRDIFEFVL